MDTEGIVGLTFIGLFAIWWIYDLFKDIFDLRRKIGEDFVKMDETKKMKNIKYARKLKIEKLNEKG